MDGQVYREKAPIVRATQAEHTGNWNVVHDDGTISHMDDATFQRRYELVELSGIFGDPLQMLINGINSADAAQFSKVLKALADKAAIVPEADKANFRTAFGIIGPPQGYEPGSKTKMGG